MMARGPAQPVAVPLKITGISRIRRRTLGSLIAQKIVPPSRRVKTKPSSRSASSRLAAACRAPERPSSSVTERSRVAR